MLKLYISVCVLVAALLAFASAGALTSYGRCTSAINEPGLCIQIADCQYILNILQQRSQTAEEKSLLKRSQCGMDNTQRGLERRVLVCCPDKYCKTAASSDARIIQPGNILPAAGTCGNFISDRIYGGNVTIITEYPWMALIESKTQDNARGFHCGGSLINSRYVVTAGHCVKSKNASDQWEISSVRLGEWNLDTLCDCNFDVRCKDCEHKGCQNCGCECAPPYMDVPIEMTIAHPEYVAGSQNQYNDIALLRMDRSVQYTEFIKPICMPVAQELRDNTFVGRNVWVAGWGMTEYMPSSPVKLQIEIKTYDLNECRKTYRSRNKVVSEMHQLCAGGEQGIDACGGDSGGPLMVTERMGNRNIYFLAGIVSYGPQPCGIKNWPGVYTRVGGHMDWILGTLEP